MKPIVKISLVLVAALAGLGVGYAWRGRQAARAEVIADEMAGREAAGDNTTNGPRRHTTHTRDDSPLATQLARDLSMSSGVTAWLYWLAALEKAQAADFPRLAQLAKNNPAALRFVAARWASVAPRNMFDSLAATSRKDFGPSYFDLERALLNDWVKRDPEAVIAALNEPQVAGGMRNLRNLVVDAIIATDPERGLKLLSEWSIQNFGPRMSGVAKWAAQDPRHAAQFTLDNTTGYASSMAMEAIGKEWGKTDPAAALAFAATKPGDLTTKMASAAMSQWAAQDMNAAGTWLATTDAGSRNRLAPALMEVWAKEDAGGAIGWCEENLSGSGLSQAVAGVLKGAAKQDVAAAAALVSGMDTSPEKAAGAVAVAKKWFPDSLGGGTIKPEAVQWLATLDPESRNRALDEIHWQWSSVDPKSIADFISSSGGEGTSSWTYSHVARELARKDPEAALAWASQQASDRAVSIGSDAFVEWSQSQPGVAMTWLNALPASDPRRQVYLQSAVRGFAYDPGSTEQLVAYSKTDPAAAQKAIDSMSLDPARRARLLEVMKPR